MAIVLEDVTIRGFAPGDQLGGATSAAAVAAVRGLAQLHARWWAEPTLAEHAWLSVPSEWAHLDELAADWGRFPDEFLAGVDKGTRATVDLMLSATPRIHQRAAEGPLTLSHGDFRFDNLCFGADGQVLAFDWQLLSRAPGARDLAFFAGLTQLPDLTADETWRLLTSTYYEQLRSVGVEYEPNAYEYDLKLNSFYFFRIGLSAIGAIDMEQPRNRELGAYIMGRIVDLDQRLELGDFLRSEFGG